jgi:putative transposase
MSCKEADLGQSIRLSETTKIGEEKKDRTRPGKNRLHKYLAKKFERGGSLLTGTADPFSLIHNTAADALNETRKQQKKKKILIRQVKYLNNIVEQDHRGIKRVTRPMLGFKSFYSAQKTIFGIELMRMLHKQQMDNTQNLTPAEQFYSLAG